MDKPTVITWSKLIVECDRSEFNSKGDRTPGVEVKQKPSLKPRKINNF
jgi:hypothetical protein